MRLIDTHFHLDAYPNHAKVYSMINTLCQYTICVTNTTDIFEACKQHYEETSYLKFALGMNPKCLNNMDFDINTFDILSHKTKYIGEIGLDFSKAYYKYKEKQIHSLIQIFEAVSNQNKVISLHCYRADKELYELLRKYNLGGKCIIHWFTGDIKDLINYIELGCYFSLNIGQTKKAEFKEYFTLLPKDNILIESDGPNGGYISKKYMPDMLSSIYQVFQSMCDFDLAEQVFANFKNLLLK